MAKRIKIAPLWYPKEWLSDETDQSGHAIPLPKEKRKKLNLPALNTHLVNIIEKNGVWRSAQWPYLVMQLVNAGMRKKNLTFRQVHARNLENVMRYIAFHSDALSGCINFSKLIVEIAPTIGVSTSTMYYMIKELYVMGLLDESEYSSFGAHDILHGGVLPKTMCATPLFYEMIGIDYGQLFKYKEKEIAKRKAIAKKRGKVFDPNEELKKICQNNMLRVWEHRHTQQESSYKIKIRDMPEVQRMAYIAKKLVKRIMDKGWQVRTDAKTINKMAYNLLNRMGLAPKPKSSPIPT